MKATPTSPTSAESKSSGKMPPHQSYSGANVVESRLNKGGDANWRGSRKGSGSAKKGMDY